MQFAVGEQKIIQLLTCAFSGLPNIFVVFRTPECLRLNHTIHAYIHTNMYFSLAQMCSRKRFDFLLFAAKCSGASARLPGNTRYTYTLGENLMCVSNKNKVIYYLFVVIIREHNNKRRSQCSARDAERDNHKFLEENRICTHIDKMYIVRQNDGVAGCDIG